MKKRLVLTAGNEMMGDDAAGTLLARMMENVPLEGWDVLDGGSVPENYVYKVREMEPAEVLIVDAAEMQLPPGEVRLIDRSQVGSLSLMTTHSLPLSFLMEAIGEFVPKVQLVGIQPETVAFGYPTSRAVEQAVERVYEWLRGEAGGAVVRIQ